VTDPLIFDFLKLYVSKAEIQVFHGGFRSLTTSQEENDFIKTIVRRINPWPEMGFIL